ncbi:MAG: hypothetical protein ACHP7K_08065, partial [Actinomycetales bacterium]
MLRIRPIRFTSRMDSCGHLLDTLGLAVVEDHGGWKVLDCGDGRIGLHAVPAGDPRDGTMVFGVEIRDRAEFARRTLAAGTRAELVETEHGPSVRVTAPDGTGFLADPAAQPSADRSVQPAAGRAELSLRVTWTSADPAAAARVLADIGAKPVDGADAADTSTAWFRAKNGGLAGTAAADGTSVAFGFAYDGVLEPLLADLTAGGIAARIVSGPDGAALLIPDPDTAGRSRP